LSPSATAAQPSIPDLRHRPRSASDGYAPGLTGFGERLAGEQLFQLIAVEAGARGGGDRRIRADLGEMPGVEHEPEEPADISEAWAGIG
jgi:hypothetical protein